MLVVLVGDSLGGTCNFCGTDFEGTISIGYGVVADIANSAERGSYVGALACGLVLQSYLCPSI